MLTIECDPPREFHCTCCGGTTVNLTRFVREDNDAYAVYYARYGTKHPERVVEVLVSIGEWGEGSEPWDRAAFPLRIWTVDDQYQVGCIEAGESPWQDAPTLGRLLGRGEALAHERIADVFHITDHIVTDDAAVMAYFAGAV